MDLKTRDRLTRLQECERAVIDLIDPDMPITIDRREHLAELLELIHSERQRVLDMDASMPARSPTFAPASA